MSSQLQYAHELLDRMSAEQIRAMVKQMERVVWHTTDHTELDVNAIQDVIRPIAEQHGVQRVWLFGSRARGDSRPESDYDFLVSSGKMRGLIQYAAFVDDLECALKSHVDVISENCPDDKLLGEARKDAVLVYEQAG